MLKTEVITILKKKLSRFFIKTPVLKKIYLSFKELSYRCKLKQKYKKNQSNLIIYTMGKVGSTSIYNYFKYNSSLNVFHVHHLNKNYLKKRRKALYRSADKYLKQPHLWTDLLWKPNWINKTFIKDNNKNLFVTILRDPIKRNESSLVSINFC